MRLLGIGLIALGLTAAGVEAASICSELNADDAYLANGMPGDLDHVDNKLVKLESRGGRSQQIFCSGAWKLSRQAALDKMQGMTIPIKLSSKTAELDVAISIYSTKTKGWHPVLSTQPSDVGDEHAPVIANWRDYYDPKSREIRFEIRATKITRTPVDLAFDQLSIRPVWHLQSISHEMAEKVAGGDERSLREHHLDGKALQPSLEMRRPELQPGQRFRQTGGGVKKAEDDGAAAEAAEVE